MMEFLPKMIGGLQNTSMYFALLARCAHEKSLPAIFSNLGF